MFQRLKGAIDSRIAEEQARQRLPQASPSRSASNTARSSSRNVSPSRKASRSVRGRQDEAPPTKGPDPADFDPGLVLDDDEQSRSGTPRPPTDRNGNGLLDKMAQDPAYEQHSQGSSETTASAEEPRTSSDLPTDVRVKLRKLEKLESRYHELLRSYRIAHARVLTIEPFETSLRETTPLTSISDPKAFVEYLNQVTLKGDMVLDELKRVSNERDAFKQKLSDAEKSAKGAWDEVADLRNSKPISGDISGNGTVGIGSRAEQITKAQEVVDEDSPGETTNAPAPSTNSPTMSMRGMSLFSPKAVQTKSPDIRPESEDFFSYDGEIPRLESELKDRQHRIDDLEKEIKSLKGDLLVTRESTQSMVQTLEEATRELNGLRESKDRSEVELKEQRDATQNILEKLRSDLHAAESKLQVLREERSSENSNKIIELDAQLQAAKEELEDAQCSTANYEDGKKELEELKVTVCGLEVEISDLRASSKRSDKKIDTLNGIVATLRSQLMEAEEKNRDLKAVIEKSSEASRELQDRIDSSEAQSATANTGQPDAQMERSLPQGAQSSKDENPNTQDMSKASKKKSKKKKKAGKSSIEQNHESLVTPRAEADAGTAGFNGLQEELRHLRSVLDEKNAAVERMHGKLKDQEGLSEEIDTLRDDLINVGQEHVEAKDHAKNLVAEKVALEATITRLEKELVEIRGVHASHVVSSEQSHNDLELQFKDLKMRATSLQIDLSAAQQLAASRFKDLNDLRNVLQKAQPEINSLRNEAAEAKAIKETLIKKDAEFKRLDSRHEEMRLEVAGLKKTITDRELEINNLHNRLGQESSSRLKLEDASSKATQEIQRLDNERHRATESLDRLSKELEKAREELASSKARLRDLEQRSSKARSESEGLKEEIELKTAQYASAQSLMASMRDQTAEMAMQMKEARERCDSLDEEVAEAHRLLGERTREGETMRRLLADVEGRADARTREMKERMDTAIEKRDRVEEETNTAGRRRARELEDLRNKHRDLERELKRIVEDKEELEVQKRDWKRRREELEYRAEQSTQEAEELRKAMGELRDALDESERLARGLEKQKAELRRSVEDTQHRLGKLQKSNKMMADEISKFQTTRIRSIDSGAPSSRSSQDSASRLTSPAPKSKTSSSAPVNAPNGQPASAVDYVYLKNVLLQFLEQKEKKHQMQLVPVLGMLLHFDRKDEQKWMSAISSKA